MRVRVNYVEDKVLGLDGGIKVFSLPTCSSCGEVTYSEPVCPFCHSKLDYGDGNRSPEIRGVLDGL